MKNIHILPTDQPSRLVKNLKGVFSLMNESLEVGGAICNINIYITSDEEIKEDDWGLSKLNEIVKFHSGYDYRYYMKIILTTDPTLIADGVQAIDNDFLEWFIKNPTCEFVEVYEVGGKLFAEPIIPQEEPKQESHICKYCDAETTQPDDECYAKPKQETLEEAAERLFRNESGDMSKYRARNIAIELANYQAERMYSEEELLDAWEIGAKEGLPLTRKKKDDLFKLIKNK